MKKMSTTLIEQDINKQNKSIDDVSTNDQQQQQQQRRSSSSSLHCRQSNDGKIIIFN